ncbi:MAG: 50S ribosomal protein L24 [Rhabdochlamydiaceae bacterium]|nr:50S ribosomal protein L24 [Candidatus Amphrikana amoebophyrae]
MSKWIKKDTKVVVIAGNDKGTSGTVIARKNDRVIVQGVNIRKKHMKAKSQDRPSEIVQMECAIHISNVALCDADGKAVKVKAINNGDKKELVIAGEQKTVLRTIKGK